MVKDVYLHNITNTNFENKEIGLYKENDSIWIRRVDIGRALEYAHPCGSMAKLHHRNKNTLKDGSKEIIYRKKLPNNYVTQTHIFYNINTVKKVCQISRQPKAKKFLKWINEKVAV